MVNVLPQPVFCCTFFVTIKTCCCLMVHHFLKCRLQHFVLFHKICEKLLHLFLQRRVLVTYLNDFAICFALLLYDLSHSYGPVPRNEIFYKIFRCQLQALRVVCPDVTARRKIWLSDKHALWLMDTIWFYLHKIMRNFEGLQGVSQKSVFQTDMVIMSIVSKG